MRDNTTVHLSCSTFQSQNIWATTTILQVRILGNDVQLRCLVATFHSSMHLILTFCTCCRGVHVFCPMEASILHGSFPEFETTAIRVRLIFAHAPSHRGAKGTAFVLAAAEQLRTEGYRFELELIEGLARDKAIERYAACDVVIDQLLAGWYGGLGVEAMALGKPVVAYIREGDLDYLDPALPR